MIEIPGCRKILICLIVIIGRLSSIHCQNPCDRLLEDIDSFYWQHQYSQYDFAEDCPLNDPDRVKWSIIMAATDLNAHRYQEVRDILEELQSDTLVMSEKIKARFHTLEGIFLLEETKFDLAKYKLDQAFHLFDKTGQKESLWHFKNQMALIRYSALINNRELGDSLLNGISPQFENPVKLPLSLICEYWLVKAFLEGKKGEKTASIRSYSQALDLVGTRPEFYSYRAEALYGIGVTYVSRFELDSALSFLMDSRQVYGNADDTLNLIYSNCLDQMGVVYYYKGEFQKALPLMLSSYDIIEKVFKPDHESYGSRASNLSVVYDKLGQYERSLEYVEKSLVNTELVYGKNHSLYYTTMNNYGLTLTRLKRYPEAKAAFLEVISKMEAEGSDQSSRYGLFLDNLGRVYLRTNMLDSAEYCYTRAVENALKYNGKDHNYYITRKNNLAGLYSRQGKLTEALEIYKELIEPTKVAFGTSHPQYGIRLSNLASAYEDVGDYLNASKYYAESTDNLVDQFYNYYPTLSEVDKLDYINLQRDWMDRLFSFTEHGDHYNTGGFLQALNLAIKGLALGSHVTIRQTSGNEEMLQRWNEIRTQIGKLHTQVKSDELLDSLNELIVESEKLEIELLSKYPHDFHLKKLNHQDIRKNLKPGELAIDFFHFQFMDGVDYTDTILYGALLNKLEWPDPKVMLLGSEEKLKEAIQDFDRDGSMTRLSEIIWIPIRDYLEPVIYLSPSGILNKVPFHILEAEKGIYAFDTHELHFFQNMRDFINRKSSQPIDLESIVLFGNPNFDLNSGSSQEDTSGAAEVKNLLAANIRTFLMDSVRGLSGFSPLPGTAREIEQIAQIATRNDLNLAVFSQDQAGEEQFKDLNNKTTSVIHLATHGFFLDHHQVEKGEQDNQRNLMLSQQDPMLRSGLALAGINRLWLASGENIKGEDGILTAYEISNLDLFNTQLVVLSACETGLGDLRNTEGVYGLQRAFRQAGVKQLIISLWKVPDQPTAELMTLFYAKLVDSLDVYRALTETQKEMAKKYPPYFWAGFVLIE